MRIRDLINANRKESIVPFISKKSYQDILEIKDPQIKKITFEIIELTQKFPRINWMRMEELSSSIRGMNEWACRGMLWCLMEKEDTELLKKEIELYELKSNIPKILISEFWGDYYVRIKENTKALEFFNKIIEEEPDNVVALDRCAEIYEQRDLQRAREYYDKILKIIHSGTMERKIISNIEFEAKIIESKASVLLALGKEEEAEKIIDEGLEKYPNDYWLNYIKGFISTVDSKYSIAEKCYQIILDQIPDDKHIERNLLRIKFLLEKIPLTKLEEYYQDDFLEMKFIIEKYFETTRKQEDIKILEELVKKHPNNFNFLLLKAIIHGKIKNSKDKEFSFSEVDKFIENNPEYSFTEENYHDLVKLYRIHGQIHCKFNEKINDNGKFAYEKRRIQLVCNDLNKNYETSEKIILDIFNNFAFELFHDKDEFIIVDNKSRTNLFRYILKRYTKIYPEHNVDEIYEYFKRLAKLVLESGQHEAAIIIYWACYNLEKNIEFFEKMAICFKRNGSFNAAIVFLNVIINEDPNNQWAMNYRKICEKEKIKYGNVETDLDEHFKKYFENKNGQN